MIHLPRPSDAKHHRDLIRSLANQLDNGTIDTLLDRARHPQHDAWPAGTTTGGSNDVARPVETVVIRKAGGRTQPDGTESEDRWLEDDDPVRQAITELFAQLAEAAGLMRIVDQRRQWLANIHDTARGRPNTVELCTGCNQPAPKVKRLDGQPYHHPDPIDGQPQPQCWWHAYRKRPNVAS